MNSSMSTTPLGGGGGGGGVNMKLQSCDRCRIKKIKCSFSSDKTLHVKQAKTTLSGDNSSSSSVMSMGMGMSMGYSQVQQSLQCKQCAEVGFECKITDKLARKSFPKGYTETLEERVRELEVENTRLAGLYELQVVGGGTTTKTSMGNNDIDNDIHTNTDSNSNTNTSGSTRGTSKLHEIPVGVANSSYDPTAISFEPKEAPGLLAAKTLEHIAQHEKSVQLAILVSLAVPRSTEEVLFTPQLIAKVGQAYGLSSKQCLYTASLLASLKENFDQPISVTGIPLANENLWNIENLDDFFKEVLKLDLFSSSPDESRQSTKGKKALGKQGTMLSFKDIRYYAELYFENWANVIPILDKTSFYTHLAKFENDIAYIILNCSSRSDKVDEVKEINEVREVKEVNQYLNSLPKSTTLSYKIFASLLVVVVQMGILTTIKNVDSKNKKLKKKGKSTHTTTITTTSKDNTPAQNNSTTSGDSAKYTLEELVELTKHYDVMLKQLVANPYFTAKTTSMPSLQFLTISLHYFTNIGDVNTMYDLKGKIFLMSQQLRLHRCPSVVLGVSGTKLDNTQQADRRLLFWAIYVLDCFSSYQLGVPRLFKDQDIECALPYSEDSFNGTNLGDLLNGDGPFLNTQIQGFISSFSLSVIRFSKVLGNVLDTIYKRHMSYDAKNVAMIHEQALDSWRRRLPENLRFKIDVNGNIDVNDLEQHVSHREDEDIGDENENEEEEQAQKFHKTKREKLLLGILYCICKCIIHLPIVAIKKLDPPEEGQIHFSTANSPSSLSYIILQQHANSLLHLLNNFKKTYLTLPLMYSNLLVHFSLICVRRALEFSKGGFLFGEIKTIITELCGNLLKDRTAGFPGCLSWYSMKLHDICMQALLFQLHGTENAKNEKLDKMLLKTTKMYERLINGKANSKKPPGSKKRKLSEEKLEFDPNAQVKPENKLALEKSILAGNQQGLKKSKIQQPSIPSIPVFSTGTFNIGKQTETGKTSGFAPGEDFNDGDGGDDGDNFDEEEEDEGIIMKTRNSISNAEPVKAFDSAVKLARPFASVPAATQDQFKPLPSMNIPVDSNEAAHKNIVNQNSKWANNVNAISEAFQMDPVLSITDLNSFFSDKQKPHDPRGNLGDGANHFFNANSSVVNIDQHLMNAAAETAVSSNGMGGIGNKINGKAAYPPIIKITSSENMLPTNNDRFILNSKNHELVFPRAESFLKSLKDNYVSNSRANSNGNTQFDTSGANMPPANMNMLNGLFSVPSNGNFLKEFMRPSTSNMSDFFNVSNKSFGENQKSNNHINGLGNFKLVSKENSFENIKTGTINNNTNNHNNNNHHHHHGNVNTKLLFPNTQPSDPKEKPLSSLPSFLKNMEMTLPVPSTVNYGNPPLPTVNPMTNYNNTGTNSNNNSNNTNFSSKTNGHLGPEYGTSQLNTSISSNNAHSTSMNNLMFSVDASLGLVPLLELSSDLLTPPASIHPNPNQRDNNNNRISHAAHSTSTSTSKSFGNNLQNSNQSSSFTKSDNNTPISTSKYKTGGSSGKQNTSRKKNRTVPLIKNMTLNKPDTRTPLKNNLSDLFSSH